MSTFEELTNEVLVIRRQFAPLADEYNSIEVREGGSSFSMFPNPFRKEELTRLLLTLAPKISKGEGGVAQAQVGNVTVRLWSLVCEKVGTKKIVRSIMKETGETAEYEIPVYSCRLPFEQKEN